MTTPSTGLANASPPDLASSATHDLANRIARAAAAHIDPGTSGDTSVCPPSRVPSHLASHAMGSIRSGNAEQRELPTALLRLQSPDGNQLTIARSAKGGHSRSVR